MGNLLRCLQDTTDLLQRLMDEEGTPESDRPEVAVQIQYNREALAKGRSPMTTPTDIAKLVDWLRKEADDWEPEDTAYRSPTAHSIRTAANEIERLSTALASANERNERLREALIYLVNAHEFVEKRRGVLPEVPKALAQARTLLQSIPNKGDGQ